MQELEDLLKQSPRLLYNASMDLLTAVLGTNLARHVLPVVDGPITSGQNKFFNQHFRNLTESRILRMSGGSCLPKNTFESVLKISCQDFLLSFLVLHERKVRSAIERLLG